MTDRTATLVVRCNICNKDQELQVRPQDAEEYLHNRRRYVQDIFPYLSVGERELLISGICPKCFNEVFGGEDNE